MQNKTYAVKRRGADGFRWWAAIDMGENSEGGWTTGGFFSHCFKKDGRTYRYYAELFQPEGLEEWQEIKTLDKTVTIVSDSKHNAFEGWEDRPDGALESLQRFARLLGKELTIEEIKKLIE